MGGGQMETPARFQAAPGLGNRFATAAGNRKIAQSKGTRYTGGTAYHVTSNAGEASRLIVAGRMRWALEELRRAGARSCTAIDNPAPRSSAYICKLSEAGVEIATLTEPRGGRSVARMVATPCARPSPRQRRARREGAQIHRLRVVFWLTFAQSALVAALAYGDGGSQ